MQIHKLVFLALVLAMSGCGSSGVGPSTPTSEPVSIEFLDGQTGIEADSSFSYTFSEDVNSSSVTSTTFFMVATPQSSISVMGISANLAAFPKAAIDTTICNSANAISASISQSSSDAKKYILTPSSNLSYDGTYSACLTTGIQYSSGSSFAGFMATFVSEANPTPPSPTTPPTVSLVTDGGGSSVLTGTTGVNLSYLGITFSKEMNATSVTTAGNVTLTCGSFTPTISLSASGTTGKQFTVAIGDSYKYALLSCTLTATTNVTDSSGTAMSSASTHTFTAGCAVSDDFNANSQSCWDIDTTNTTRWTTWAQLVANLITFDTANSEMDYAYTADTEAVRTVIQKTLSRDTSASQIEVDVHFTAITGYGAGAVNNEQFLLGIYNVSGTPQTLYFGIAYSPTLITRACYIRYDYNSVTSVGLAETDCSAAGARYIKIIIPNSSTAITMQQSTNGTTYNDIAATAGAFPNGDTFIGRMSSTAYLLINAYTSGANNKAVSTDSIVVTGMDSTSQY